METRKYREDIYAFEDEGVRSFLLLGEEQALLVDSGWGTFDLLKAVNEVTDLPLIFVNTHSDVDHTGGNAVFEEVYLHEMELPLIKKGRPNDRARYLLVTEGYRFDLGGVIWEVIHCPGHTPGSIALFDERGRVLIPGDTVSDAEIYMFGSARNHQDYRTSLQILGDYDTRVDNILPSHGSCPLTGLKALTLDLLSALDKYESGTPDFELAELNPNLRVKCYRHGRGAIYTETAE